MTNANPAIARIILAMEPNTCEPFSHVGYAHKGHNCSLRTMVNRLYRPGYFYTTVHFKDGVGVSCFAVEDHDGKKT